MAVTVESPRGKAAFEEFLNLYDQVHASREARWAASAELQLSILEGEGPFVTGRRVRPFLARRSGAGAVARVAAVVDERYNRHWNQRLGHLVWFEAKPDSREAVKRLMDEASDWLASEGCEAGRAGFGLFDFPFVIDDYRSLPPEILRHNPDYYHVLLKDAGFESEQGWVDYKIEVGSELVRRWESALEGARRAGYEIVRLKDVPVERRASEFADTWNDTFRAHWGFTPFIEEEVAVLLEAFGAAGALETSLLAYESGRPIGFLFVLPDATDTAILAPGRALRDDEKLNVLAIGVRESARGRGVNLAMAAYTYLELARRGAKYLSYTLVLDDNWPSRRTGEKLGARACANYMVYRRNFRR